MRIINPTFGVAAAGGAKVALKPVNWATDAIALVSNSKPNARELLSGIRDKLGVEPQDVLDLNHVFRQRGYRKDMGVKGAVAVLATFHTNLHMLTYKGERK